VVRAELHPGRGGPESLSIDTGEVYGSLEAADLDGDGWLDLAGARYAGSRALVTILGPGGKVKSGAAMSTGSLPAAVGLGRLDRHGDLDLLVPCAGSSNLAIYHGKGDGSFAPARFFPSISRPKDIALGDLDGDGLLDAALISTEEVGVHFGNESGDVLEPLSLDRSPKRRFVGLALADLSGDGVHDVVALEKRQGLLLFRSAGGRRFEERDLIRLSSIAFGLAVGDLDGDGLADPTVTTFSNSLNGDQGSVEIYLNRGGGFPLRAAYVLPFVPIGHRLADLDLDGALDVVAFDSESAFLLFGNSTTAPVELFRRGDADGDGAVELNDAIAVLSRLFLGGDPPACPDGADANDDGEVNLTDPITLLNRLFLGAAPLPPPGPGGCGEDPTADALAACAARC
jgi:hypothetical protein